MHEQLNVGVLKKKESGWLWNVYDGFCWCGSSFAVRNFDFEWAEGDEKFFG